MDGNPLQLRARRVPAPLRFTLIALALGGAFASVVFDTYPFRFFAGAEDAIAGGHHVVLGGLLAMVVTLIPAIVLVHVIASFLPPTAEERGFTELV